MNQAIILGGLAVAGIALFGLSQTDVFAAEVGPVEPVEPKGPTQAQIDHLVAMQEFEQSGLDDEGFGFVDPGPPNITAGTITYSAAVVGS